MEHFNRANPPAATHQSRDSSVSSIESGNELAFPTCNGSPVKVHTRAASSTPSYMNHVPINRKPVGSRNITPDSLLGSTNTAPNQIAFPPPPPPEPKGTLILAIAASPHHSTIFYLRSMLKKSSHNQIIVIGRSEKESELKQLKVEIYALLGKLGQEIGVDMELRSSWEEGEISSAVAKGIGENDAIHGVLCCPSYESAHASGTDIMNIEQTELETPWKSSISFVHSVAKYTLPNLRTGGHEHKKPGLFLVTSPSEQSPISTLYNAGCRTLMTLLVAANAGKSLTIDYAENVLLPEPESVTPNSNGRPALSQLHVNGDSETDEYPPPESPTKLWALYNELGAAD